MQNSQNKVIQMNRQVRKLKQYMIEYLGKSEDYLRQKLGKPLQFSESDVLFYYIPQKLIFRDEIAFFVESKIVKDIGISQYFIGSAYRNIFFLNEPQPHYKIQNLWFRRNKEYYATTGL